MTDEIVGNIVLKTEEEMLASVSNEVITEILRNMALAQSLSHTLCNTFADAFIQVEKTEGLVTDVVCNVETSNLLRKYGSDWVTMTTDASKMRLGLVGSVLGARLWLDKDTAAILAFAKDSKQFHIQFPKFASRVWLCSLEKECGGGT